MNELFFIWIGSGRTRKIKGISPKCIYLDKALRAGLPVPNGGIILDWFYQLALEEQVAFINRERVQIDTPVAFSELLYQSVRLPRFDKPTAIRTAFTPKLSAPIVKLNFDSNQPQELAATFQHIWGTVPHDDEAIRRDVIMMEMVNSTAEGTAVLQGKDEPDQTTILGQETTLTIPPLGRWGRTDDNLPEYGRRLQKLLKGVKRTFGDTIEQVSWADDGQICWLLQLIPRTD